MGKAGTTWTSDDVRALAKSPGASAEVRRLNPKLFGVDPLKPLATEVFAKANHSKPKGRQMNRTEREYSMILSRKFPTANIRYEGYSLKLAEGCRYIPDFAVELQDGRLEFHEVKGAFIFSKALTKPKTAAELFPQRFVLAQKIKGEWHITTLRGKADR